MTLERFELNETEITELVSDLHDGLQNRLGAMAGDDQAETVPREEENEVTVQFPVLKDLFRRDMFLGI